MVQRTYRTAEQCRPISDLIHNIVDRIDEWYHQSENITGVPSGFPEFDQLTNGLQSAQLMVIAGRPSMGVSTFSTNIIEHVAIDSGIGVAFFSMQMPAEDMVLRILSSRGKINQTRIRSGQLSENEWCRLTKTIQSMNQADIFIDDTPAVSPSEIYERVLHISLENNIGLIVIDNIQLMTLQKKTKKNNK